MRTVLLLVCLSAGCARQPAPWPEPTPSRAAVSPAEAVVQAQVDAYNRRDLDAFLATYAPDIRIYDHPAQLRMSGLEQLRRRYGQLFEAAPELHAAIGRRIVQGDYVVDHETVTGLLGGDTIRAVAIYQVRQGRIHNVWFIR